MTRQYYPDQPHSVPMKKDRYGNTYFMGDEYVFNAHGVELIVLKGFRYDGASVPRIAWTLSGLCPDGLLRAAALVHDILYLQNGFPTIMTLSPQYKLAFTNKPNITRKDADKLFKKIMLECGVTKWRAQMAYVAVRIGGRFYRNF